MVRLLHRRKMLGALAGAGTAAVAGCTTGGNSDSQPDRDQDSQEEESTDTPSRESVTTETPETSEPIVGSASPGKVSDFEDLSQWSEVWGSFRADSNHYFSGSQSALLEIHENHDRAAIGLEFEEPIDMTGLGVKVALRADRNVYPWVQIFDVNRNRIDFRTALRGGLAFQWFNFGIQNVEGDPDLSAIDEIRIAEHIGEENTARIWCDELHFVDRPTPGKVLLTFDDTNATDYTTALPMLKDHGFVGSTFVNSGLVGQEDNKLTVEHLSELYDSGWDICNHTTQHQNLPKLSRGKMEAAIREGKQWLVDHGFDRGAEYFAYPKSSYDQSVLDLVEQYHTLGFVGGYPAIGEISNELLIHRPSGDVSAEAARHRIDLTAEYGGITTLLYHHLTDKRESALTETVEYLAEQESAGAVEVIPARALDS